MHGPLLNHKTWLWTQIMKSSRCSKKPQDSWIDLLVAQGHLCKWYCQVVFVLSRSGDVLDWCVEPVATGEMTWTGRLQCRSETGPRRTCSQGPRSSALSAAAPFVCMKRAELPGLGASTSYTTETSQPLHHQSSPFALAGEGCDTMGVLPPDPIPPPGRLVLHTHIHTHRRSK